MIEIWTSLVSFLRDDLLIVLSVGIGCTMVSANLERRGRFWLRAVLSFLASALWMMCTQPLMKQSGGFPLYTGLIRYNVLFVLLGLSVPFCSKANFCQTIYAIAVSYSIQNACERLIEIPRYSLPGFPVLLDRLCLMGLMALSLYFYHRTLVGKHRQRSMFDFSNLNSRTMLFVGAGVLTVTIVLDMLIRGELRNSSRMMLNYVNLSSAIFSFMVVVICMSHLRESDNERKARISAQLLYAERSHYEQDKQIHDAINIKCHDIRHQIAAMDEKTYKYALKNIDDLVNLYDTTINTKNAALDVVLQGKMLSCTQQGITLTCLADGRRMSFMEDSDIYALFGNILDNAMEATMQVQNKEQHLISLTVGTMGDLLRIECQNFYEGNLVFKEGLPETSKANKDYHGFGTRSIQTIAEKYSGDLKIDASDGIFYLSVMIPITK